MNRAVVWLKDASGRTRRYVVRLRIRRFFVLALALAVAGGAGWMLIRPVPSEATIVDAGRVPLHRVPPFATPARPSWQPGSPPTHVAIPSIDLSAPVIPEVVTAGALGIPPSLTTVGWWSGGAGIGASSGTTVLAAHVDGRIGGVPTMGSLFWLKTVSLGATVVVTTSTGTANFRVVARQLINKPALPFSEIFTDSGEPRLVLITCGGAFNSTTDQYASNVVVWAVPST